MKEDETSNLSKGVVLKLLDDERAISGGSINWNTDDSSFAYTEGNLQSVDKFYLNEKGEILLEETEDPISIDIVSYTIRDIRKGNTYEYPIVKIGTQYWMREDLCATGYRNGTTLNKKTQLGEGLAISDLRVQKHIFIMEKLYLKESWHLQDGKFQIVMIGKP